MFSLAKIYTFGIATSVLAGKHVKHTRYAYMLTLALLNIRKDQAYDAYYGEGYGPRELMDMRDKRHISKNLLLDNSERLPPHQLVRPGSTIGHWPLTLNACNDMCLWFFAFGHTNYARLMPVFRRDMARHPDTHSSVFQGFHGVKVRCSTC